nr:hypothetical protein [Bacteroidota bacterium]
MKKNALLRNILAVIAGIVIGGIVNMGIVMLGGSIIPPPEGVDVSSMESLKSAMHLFQPINFVFPFLAHALGTLVGAIIAALIAANRKMLFALGIGFVFLIGGIIMVIDLPAPLWFNVLDLVIAYIPMGVLGGFLAGAYKK